MLEEKQKTESWTEYRDRLYKKLRRKQKLRAFGAAVTTLAALAGAGGKVYAGDVLLAPKVMIERIEHGHAPRVPEAQFQRVKRILDQPQNPELTRLHQKWNRHLENRSNPRVSDRELYNFYSRQAEAHGFHLGDTLTYDKKIGEAGSIDGVLEATNELTSQYGFSVSIPQTTGLKELELGIKTIDHETVPLDDIKVSAQCIVNAVELIPLELAPHLGVRSIRIVDEIDPWFSQNTEEAGLHNSLNRIIYINRAGRGTTVETVGHEIGHQIDRRTAGLYGMGNDPGFTKLNPPGFKYGDPSQPSGGAWPSRQFNKPGQAVIEEHGLTNVGEDKATYYSVILGSWEVGVRGPIVKEKVAYLVARLDKLLPGYADYYSDISFKK